VQDRIDLKLFYYHYLLSLFTIHSKFRLGQNVESKKLEEITMKIHTIQPQAGSKKKEKRLGRGIASGHGKTCCKGHKGQWARSGGGVSIGFEGGQKPLMRRIPKRGFDNAFKKEYSIVNLSDLERFDAKTEINAETLLEFGILSKVEEYGVKILGSGTLTKALTVKANKFSEGAKKAIEAAGGKVIEIEIINNSLNEKGKKRPLSERGAK